MPFDRLLFIQHGLTKNSGHWLMETNEWRNAARTLNLKWFGAAHVSLENAIASAYDLKPIFPFRPHDTIVSTPVITKLATFIELSDAFKHIGQKHFPADISPTDLLFIAFSSETDIFGVAKWLDTIHPDKRPTVAFMFHQFDPSWKTDVATLSINGDFSTWEYAARALSQRLPPHKIRFFSAGDLLSDALSKIFKIPTHTLPIASPVPTQILSGYRDKKYDVGILGGARYEQGVDMWADIFVALAKLRPDLTISLQVNTEQQEQILRNALGGHIPPSHIDIHTGPLMGTSYYERMANCQLLLLTYLPERYCFRESGVFIEAVSRDIPTVVPEFTTMARHIQSGRAAGVACNNGNATSIADSVHSALNNIEELYQRSSLLSETWQNKHKAENILRSIL